MPALAACGSSEKRSVTVQAYGDHPATTIAVTSASPGTCRTDADAFGDAARMFLAHSGRQASYPADLYLVLLRESLADFQAHGCDPAVLAAVLRARLSAPARAQLVDGLPSTMASVVSTALRGS